MNFALDIVLIAIAAFIIIKGYKNGLVKSIINLVCDVAAVVVAYALTPTVAAFLCKSTVLDKISAGIDSTVRSAAATSAGTDVSAFLSSIPGTLEGTLEKYNVNDEALRGFVKGLSDTGESAVKSVSEFIAKPTAWILSNTLAFIGLFIVALIVLKLASKLILLIFKAPIIKTADKAAGAALGALNALIVLWVLSLAISIAVGSLGSIIPGWFEDTVENSIILKFFASYNPITIIRKLLERIGS